nr:RNA polymerase beta subunit protein a [Parallela transversalis]AYQ22863.1 RNA polymerase beta subunit protein a [Parallela transversalis]
MFKFCYILIFFLVIKEAGFTSTSLTFIKKMQELFLADFLLIQRKSFFDLLNFGLIEEFQKRNPITNLKKDLELFFYPEYYRLTSPELTIKEAIVKGKTYSSKIYIPVQLTNRTRKTMTLKWVLIGHLPLLSKRGHFLINGSARIIINQIIRSPGIYFHEKIYDIYSNKWSEKPVESHKRYYADLISLKGTWLRLEMDKEKAIWAKMKKGPKIPILWLLIGMGLSERILLQTLPNSSSLLFNHKEDEDGQVKYRYTQHPPQAWKELYFITSSKLVLPEKASELGRKWLFKKFMNPRSYDLGKQGRISFNKKLGLNFSLNQRTLTAQDLLFATDSLLKLEKGLKKIDDIDHLKNRRVRTSAELLQIQIGIGLMRLEKEVRDKMSKTQAFLAGDERKIRSNLVSSSFSISKQKSIPSFSSVLPTEEKERSKDYDLNLISNQKLQILTNRKARIQKKDSLTYFINTKPFNGALKEFFGSSQLSQYMDQMNPLSEITHKRRISSLGPGGISRDRATFAIRGIHPSHYGRICPIETPEGKNTGLVNSMTVYARVSSEGLLLTPFYKVYRGQVQKDLGMFFLSAEEEEKMKIASADVNQSEIHFLPKASLPVRIADEFTRISRQNIDFIGVSPIQMISLATSLIPFLEHDDANRALMGSNMQRQSVPLIRPERAIVGTGLEGRAASDSGHVLQADQSGFVAYVSGKKIIVYTVL